MDLGLDFATGSSPNEPAKRRAVGNTCTDQTQINQLLAKACLSSSLQVRVLRAATLDAFRVPVDNLYAVAIGRATQAHHQLAEAKRKEGI